MAASDTLSPETIRRLKRRYEETDEKVSAIAADVGLSRGDLMALQRRFGWRTRTARKTKPAAKTKAKSKTSASQRTKRKVAQPTTSPPPGAVDMPTLIVRIRAQLEGALRTAQAQGADLAPEETARLMHNLTRTLQMLRALEKDTAGDERRDDGADEPPLDLAELRRDLARKIDLLRQERDGA